MILVGICSVEVVFTLCFVMRYVSYFELRMGMYEDISVENTKQKTLPLLVCAHSEYSKEITLPIPIWEHAYAYIYACIVTWHMHS